MAFLNVCLEMSTMAEKCRIRCVLFFAVLERIMFQNDLRVLFVSLLNENMSMTAAIFHTDNR